MSGHEKYQSSLNHTAQGKPHRIGDLLWFFFAGPWRARLAPSSLRVVHRILYYEAKAYVGYLHENRSGSFRYMIAMTSHKGDITV